LTVNLTATFSPRQTAFVATVKARSSDGQPARPDMSDTSVSSVPSLLARTIWPSTNSTVPSVSFGIRLVSGAAGLASTSARVALIARVMRPPRVPAGSGSGPGVCLSRNRGRTSTILEKDTSPPRAAIADRSSSTRSA
jgi:hypothetical protein